MVYQRDFGDVIVRKQKDILQKSYKEFEYSYPTKDGENRLQVTVYNDSGVSETVRVMFNK